MFGKSRNLKQDPDNLGLLLVYRFGAHVTLLGIDATQLTSFSRSKSKSGIGSILDVYWWFSKASVFF
jgi:preprotein translocase subunit SecY